MPLRQVFASLEKQTGVSFFFNYAILNSEKLITLDVKNVTLEEVLKRVLKDENLDYFRMGKTIFIVKKQITREEVDSAKSRMSDIRGIVLNQDGEALAGATVAIRNGKKATLTDEKGGFLLKNVAAGTVLEITYLGYQKQEIEVTSSSTLRIVMSVASNKLDEAQVIAYGNTTERQSTGNISLVKGADIAKQPVQNPLLALEGRVPGLVITQSTGLPGTGVKVLIEGQNSMVRGNDPFYVIDGVPYNSLLLPNLGNILGVSGINTTSNGNPLSYINSSDIESIEILKDAAATSIYGSRAANGAILITTKKGKAGQTRVDLNFQDGVGQVGHKMSLLNTPQYLEMRHEALRNDGISAPASTDYDINGFWDSTRYTDWQKVLIGGTTQYTDAQGSVSGGTTLMQYLVGGSYHRETSVYPGSFSDQKGSVHFSLNNTTANQRFKFQFTGSYLIDNNQLPNNDLTLYALSTAPDAPVLKNPDGSANWMPNASGTSTWINPLSFLYNTYQNKTNNLISNAILDYSIFSGLNVKANLGYTNIESNEILAVPLISTAPESRPTANRRATYEQNNGSSWLVEPQLNYKHILGEGKLDVLIGMTIQQNLGTGQAVQGSGYNSDLVLNSVISAATLYPVSSTYVQYKYNAGFGRINYNWKDKFILDLSARRDGSSRFGSANQFHNFEAAGAAWVFSQENFIRKELPFISFGKLRGSYGTTGNDQIGDYLFLNLYNPVGVTYQGATGLTPAGLTNPYLQWEQTEKLQFGLDLGFLSDRILVNANYYHNQSSNQLLSYALPIITGWPAVVRNFPATVENTGYEGALTTVNIRSRKFSWTTNINFTVPQNKLVSFPNLATSSYASTYVIGKPITTTMVYRSAGVNPTTGIFQFIDAHGNVTTNPNYSTDRTVLINTASTLYGGFENSFQFEGLELDVLFQFVKQRAKTYFFGNLPGRVNLNQPTTVLNRWQKPGDVAANQRFNSNLSVLTPFNDELQSNAAYKDGSYARLKNLSISWQLPQAWRERAHLKACRVYLQGQNLITFTHYKGLDPETLSTSTLPPLRVVTAGIQLGL